MCLWCTYIELNNAEKRLFKFGSLEVELMPLSTELQSYCLGLSTEDYKFSPIEQEYPFLPVSEIVLSRPAVSA